MNFTADAGLSPVFLVRIPITSLRTQSDSGIWFSLLCCWRFPYFCGKLYSLLVCGLGFDKDLSANYACFQSPIRILVDVCITSSRDFAVVYRHAVSSSF